MFSKAGCCFMELVMGEFISVPVYLCWLCTQYSKHWGSSLCHLKQEFYSENDLEWRYLTKKRDEQDGSWGSSGR